MKGLKLTIKLKIKSDIIYRLTFNALSLSHTPIRSIPRTILTFRFTLILHLVLSLPEKWPPN